MFDFDKSLASKDDDLFHFVAFVPIKGRLYELDGLQEGPIDLGPCDQENWLSVAKPLLDERMHRWAWKLNCITMVTSLTVLVREKYTST